MAPKNRTKLTVLYEYLYKDMKQAPDVVDEVVDLVAKLSVFSAKAEDPKARALLQYYGLCPKCGRPPEECKCS